MDLIELVKEVCSRYPQTSSLSEEEIREKIKSDPVVKILAVELWKIRKLQMFSTLVFNSLLSESPPDESS